MCVVCGCRFNAINRLLHRLTLIQLYRSAEEAGVTPATAAKGLPGVFEDAGGVSGVPEVLIAAYRAALTKEQPGGTKVGWSRHGGLGRGSVCSTI